MARKKLGELLVRAGAITEGQLRRALSEQTHWKAPLGHILVGLGFISEEKLIKALSYQLNVPIAHLEQIEIPKAVLDLVPAEFCQEHGVLPFRRDESGRFLDVAMVEPLNLDVLENLRVITKHNIRSYLATYTDMARAMRTHLGVVLRTPDGPAPVFATGLDAREISPSGYHLAATAAGAPVRELGSRTLETNAVSPSLHGTPTAGQETAQLAVRLSDLERDILHLTRRVDALAENQQGMPQDQVQRFSRSIKSLATAVTQLKEATERTDNEVARLTTRLQQAEALQERDERVLKKLLGLFVTKGLATSDELRKLLEKP